jgi:hypothetical protein
MRFYIAAPIFTPAQLEVVERIKDLLEQKAHEVFSPYHASRDIWAGRAPKDCSPEERKQVVDQNIDNLRWCDILLAWVGGNEAGFTDAGVIWEMGYAKAILWHNGEAQDEDWPQTIAYIDDSDVRKSMNLMLAGTVDAVAIGYQQLIDLLSLIHKNEWPVIYSNWSPEKQLLQESEKIT